jgi:hypothetical protein
MKLLLMGSVQYQHTSPSTGQIEIAYWEES